MELGEDGGLVVVAPRHWSASHIRQTLSLNASRVEQFLRRARNCQLEPLQYVQGEAHLYLGTRYPLNVNMTPGIRPTVNLSSGVIRVSATETEKIKALLQSWYRRQADEVFHERLDLLANRASWVTSGPVPLKLRKMKRTWGNCSSRGVIKLNTHLIKAPLHIIDSVIAHELCHLEEMNHSNAFYALLESLNPGWRKDRQQLRSEGHIYLL
jgi:predicted metal-dependent hydrolase